jgi:AraC-like DNA-binding protein
MEPFLKETKHHGSEVFPMAVYPIVHRASEGDVQPFLFSHWQEELEFIHVYSGCALFQVDGREYRLVAGQSLLLAPGALHGAVPFEGNDCECFAIVVPVDLFLGTKDPLLLQNYWTPLLRRMQNAPVLKHHGWEAEASALLKEVRSSYETHAYGYDLEIKAKFLTLWHLLVTHLPCAAQSPENRRIDVIKANLHYIHQHFDAEITLLDLAENCGMSTGHYCRFFKQMVKTTPFTYLMDYRIKQGKRMLLETDLRVIDIAMETGFRSPSYFTAVFQRLVGCSPTHYRKAALLQKGNYRIKNAIED